MATVTIYACERTPNQEAIEAVLKHIAKNKNNDSYVVQQEVTTKSGLVIDVTEHDFKDHPNPCNAAFSLVMVGRGPLNV